MKYYHNPRCSKSRQGLELLEGHGKKPEIIEYLKEPPDEKTLRDIVKKLGTGAESLVRKSEDIYKEKYRDRKMTEDDWIKAMVKHPILIERPILIGEKKAVIGRPSENLLNIKE